MEKITKWKQPSEELPETGLEVVCSWADFSMDTIYKGNGQWWDVFHGNFAYTEPDYWTEKPKTNE